MPWISCYFAMKLPVSFISTYSNLPSLFFWTPLTAAVWALILLLFVCINFYCCGVFFTFLLVIFIELPFFLPTDGIFPPNPPCSSPPPPVPHLPTPTLKVKFKQEFIFLRGWGSAGLGSTMGLPEGRSILMRTEIELPPNLIGLVRKGHEP